MLKKIVARILQSFIAAGLLVLFLLVACWAYPPLAILGLAIAQREYPMCSALGLYHGAQQHFDLVKIRQRIRSESRLERRDGEYEFWRTATTSFWIPKNNWHAMPTIIGQEEMGLYAHGGRVCRRGDVVIDCGAHVGVYTRQALKDGASLVVAVEPAPRNLECLRRNLAAEIAAGKVIVCPKGVWDKEDALPLYEDPGHTAADGFVAESSSRQLAQQIPLTTIDHIAAEFHLAHIDAIKMDIKGATAKALIGAKQTLSQQRPWLALSTEEEVDNPEELTKLIHEIAPAYQTQCGLCSLANRVVRPDAMLYQ